MHARISARRATVAAALAVLVGWLVIPAGAAPGMAQLVTHAQSGAASSAVGAGLKASSSHSHGLVALSKNVLPGITRLPSTGHAPASQTLHIGVGLQLPNLKAAEAYYQSEYDATSPNYGKYLTPDEFASRFGVAPATYARVVKWLRSGGLTIDQTTPAGTWVAASGTVRQLERVFHTTIAAYDVKSVSFVANTSAPKVPAGDSILSVVGLNTLQRFSTPARPSAAPTPGTPACLPSCSYGPQDMWSMYDMPSTNLGQGQTLGVFGEGRTDDVISNLRLFEKRFKLPQIPVTVKNVGPGPFTDDSGQEEWEIDTQSSTGMAPDAYGATLYFANSLFDASVESLFTAWVKDAYGPKQMNASFGECETNPTNPVTGPLSQLPYGSELGDELEPVAEQTLLQAASEGRTLFASSGDTGSSCPAIVLPVVGAGNGVANQGVPLQEYPCASSYVVCVGGTVLWSDGNAKPQRAIERGWEFGGGGASLFRAEPAFQKHDSAVNIPCVMDYNEKPFAPGTICRGVPDVAAMSGDVSDNGYDIFFNGAEQDGAGAGTSLSSPLWMGMWTRIQAASPQGLGFANYRLYNVAESSAYANDFFDVTLGDNGLYHAAPGWDYVTGWGVPDVAHLMKTMTGRLTPVYNVLPKTPPPPGTGSCNALWLNPAHTATDIFGNSDPQLTLYMGNMALSADHKTLIVKLTTQDLSTSVPAPATGMDWYMTWSYGGKEYFAQAEMGPIPTTAPSFADGTVTKTGNTNQYTPVNTDTGKFFIGRHGTVQINVPLSHIGNPSVNSVLSAPAGITFTELGIPPNPTGQSVASLQQVDTGGPTHNYTVGTTTGTTGCTLP